MEGDTTDLLRQYKTDLDKSMANVMPDRWDGHGRLAIRESDVIPQSVESKAIKKMNNIADKKGKSPERAANDLIRAVKKKKE